jgi:hypothetical protein
MSNPTKPFEPLIFPRKETSVTAGRYRVYSDPKNFVLVEAKSALEAFESSANPKAYKIVREDLLSSNLIDIPAKQDVATGS